jgi:hypothetical protein
MFQDGRDAGIPHSHAMCGASMKRRAASHVWFQAPTVNLRCRKPLAVPHLRIERALQIDDSVSMPANCWANSIHMRIARHRCEVSERCFL